MFQPVSDGPARIAVVGAGAMGGLWAGRLAAAGHEVSIVDVSPTTLEAIRERGLTVHGPSGDGEPVRVQATDTPADIGPVDLVVVFVKGPHTPAAARSLGPLVGPDTAIATLQNGWGNADVLAEHVPADRLVVGVTYEGAMVVEPGIVKHNGSGPTFVGPYTDGALGGPSERAGDLFRSAGFDAIATARVKTEIWRKLIHNSSCLPVAALTGLRTSELISVDQARELVDALAHEAVAVARAMGHDIDADERIERIHAVLTAAGMGVPSMLADVLARRTTEVDLINGAVVRAAESAGLDAPLNRSMVALVHGLERSWADRPTSEGQSG
jgi:2-dehydropantoate 2-reductase